jgi:hypothetical protein
MDNSRIEDIYPLSPMQQGMLFHSLYSPESGLYLSQLSCTFEEGLNESAFVRAWQKMVDRHPIFRTMFVWEGLDEPVQVVYKSLRVPFDCLDWRDAAPADQQTRLEKYLEADRQRGFDFSEAPLMRLSLIRLTETAYQFNWTYHHILMDAWSESLLMGEVFACYWTGCRGTEPELGPCRPYGDYIEWLQQQSRAEAEAYWRRILKGFTRYDTLKRLKRNTTNATTDEPSYAEQHVQLSEAETTDVQSAARRSRITLNTLMQGAWALLLGHYGQTRDVVFGSNVSGRPASLPGVESIIGLFINTLPARIQVEPQASLAAWLQAIQAGQAEMRQYEYSPLVQVQECSEVPRGTPLFESILVFQNAPVNTSLKKYRRDEDKLEIRNVRFRGGWTNYPLAVEVKPAAQLFVNISYDERRYGPEAIRQLLGSFALILQTFAREPEIRLDALCAQLEEADRQRQSEYERELADANQRKLKTIRRKAIRPSSTNGSELWNSPNETLAAHQG